MLKILKTIKLIDFSVLLPKIGWIKKSKILAQIAEIQIKDIGWNASFQIARMRHEILTSVNLKVMWVNLRGHLINKEIRNLEIRIFREIKGLRQIRPKIRPVPKPNHPLWPDWSIIFEIQHRLQRPKEHGLLKTIPSKELVAHQ